MAHGVGVVVSTQSAKVYVVPEDAPITVRAPFNNSKAVFNTCLHDVFAKSSRSPRESEYVVELFKESLELFHTPSNYQFNRARGSSILRYLLCARQILVVWRLD